MKNHDIEATATAVVNACYKVHRALGPGLLEKVYEVCVAYELRKAGHYVERQLQVPIIYDGITFNEALRLDLLVDDEVVVELKAVDTLNPVWEAQVLSHLRLTGKQLGFLVNFNVPLIKQGIRRYINSEAEIKGIIPEA